MWEKKQSCMGSYTSVMHFALYLMQFVGEYLNLSQYCSTCLFKCMSVKHLHSLSSVQGSSLLHEVEMQPLTVLMVLIDGVVLE